MEKKMTHLQNGTFAPTITPAITSKFASLDYPSDIRTSEENYSLITILFHPTEAAIMNNEKNSSTSPSNDDDLVKEDVVTLWQVPKNSIIGTFFWFYSWPIRCVLAITLPNPKTCRRFYLVTFVFCILWIGVVAYLIFWMLVIIGKSSNIRNSPMIW